MPVDAPPIAMLTLPPAVVHTTEPLTSWSLPSMVTFVPAAPPPPADVLAALSDPLLPVLDLLLEQPERPTNKIAAAATPTVNPRFTCAPLPVVAVHRH